MVPIKFEFLMKDYTDEKGWSWRRGDETTAGVQVKMRGVAGRI